MPNLAAPALLLLAASLPLETTVPTSCFSGTRQFLSSACFKNAPQVLLLLSVDLWPITTSALRARDSATLARLQSSRNPTCRQQSAQGRKQP